MAKDNFSAGNGLSTQLLHFQADRLETRTGSRLGVNYVKNGSETPCLFSEKVQQFFLKKYQICLHTEREQMNTLKRGLSGR